MEQYVDDVFEKYGNLFRLRVTPNIEKLYLPPPEAQREKIPAPSKGAFSIIKKDGLQEHPATPANIKDAIRALFFHQVSTSAAFKLDGFKTKILDKTPAMMFGDKAVIVYPGIRFRVIYNGNEFFLCLDHAAIVVNYLRADEVKQLLPNYPFTQARGFYETEAEGWKPGRIENIEGKEVVIQTEEGPIRVDQSKFLPDIPPAKISKLLAKKGIKADFDREIKRLGLLTVENPPRQRLQKIIEIAKTIKLSFFPIRIGNYELDLDPAPVRLLSPTFDVRTDLIEPFSIFDHEDETKRSQIILEGLTRHGSFDKPKKDINLVILTTKDRLPLMNGLLERLNTGADRYLGMGKTFGCQLIVREVFTTDNLNQYLVKCEEFVRRPDFQEVDLFFVFLPEEEGKASYDSPYYEVKKLLIKNGIPSQMVDDDTLQNPKFKDLNIALNIFSKAGYTPWVLDEPLKDADLFIGLSYSSITRGKFIDRMMAYVNIFDKYGRWKFYQGDIEVFPFEERHKHYKEIVKASINRHRAENPGIELKTIHIHYTQRMRKTDLQAINEQVTSILPDCQVVFIYINTDMPIRLFDKETDDGSIERRSYVDIGNNQFFMSTTGANIFYQKGMGTPKILTVSVTKLKDPESVDIQSVAQHILSLTRLNWASTRNFCHEPITTKFAGDISYFMNVFMKDPSFHVSERIRNKPWFL